MGPNRASMSWLLTFSVGIFAAAAGCVGAVVLAGFCASWYRISSFEGASGYYVVGIAVVGLLGGFAIGIVAARIVAARPEPGFLKAFAASLGTLGGLLAVSAVLAWLGADFAPRLEGKNLVVEVEVKLPPSMAAPSKELPFYSRSVTITADSGARHQSSGELDVEKARSAGGRWIVPGSAYLGTSDPGKSLGVKVGEVSQFFRFPLAGKPTRRDMEWGPWLTEATTSSLQPIPPTDAMAVRYRVQFYVPPPPEPRLPSDEEIAAKKKAEEDVAYAALKPDSPIGDWLRFTRYGQEEERREAAAAAIARRANVVAELSPLILSENRETSDLALRAISLMRPPPEGLAPAVSEVGHRLADEIRVVNATTPEEDPSYLKAADASVRFAGWSEAARVLHGRPGVDLRPEMITILELARVRSESLVMKDVVSVAGYWTKEWSGGATAPASGPSR
jgi:hypothetical protein